MIVTPVPELKSAAPTGASLSGAGWLIVTGYSVGIVGKALRASLSGAGWLIVTAQTVATHLGIQGHH